MGNRFSPQSTVHSPQQRPRGHCGLWTIDYGLALVVLLLLSGCAYAPLRPSYPGPQPLPPALVAYYDYPIHTPHAVVQLVRDQPKFREFLVSFPLSAPGFEPTEPIVEFEWFEAEGAGRRPAIRFYAILGGDYPLERGICRYLAHRGFHVALVHRKMLKISPERDAAYLELLLRQGILRIRQVVDWMASQDRVDPHRMGSFGISMGGMASVIAAAVEPRLHAHVVALAGGPIPDILMTSRDSLLMKPRRRYLEANHMTSDTLYRLLQEQIKTDPVRLAPYVDAREVLMFVAFADRTIGRANALRLWRALGRPKTVFLPFGHYTTYLALPYLKYASLRFFQETLKASPTSR